MRVPYTYQTPAIEWATSRDLCPVLMDKRLGKSLVAIRWAISKPVNRHLIIAPNSAIPDWMRDLERDDQNYVLLDGPMDKRVKMLTEGNDLFGNDCLFFIINPHGITKPGRNGEKGGPSPIAMVHWPSVIWDEPVYGLRNPGTMINKVGQQYLSRAKYKMFLSGEVAPEGSEDIFEPMKWLYGEFMGCKNFWRWRDINFNCFGFNWVEKPGHKLKIKEALHAKAFRMTRAEAGVGADTPPFYERRFCDLSPRMRRTYVEAEKFYHLAWEAGEVQKIQEARYALEVANWLAQLAGGYVKDKPELDSNHKSGLLVDILRHEYPTEKVVVIFRYNREIEGAKQEMGNWKNHPPYKVIWGEVPVPERKAIQQEFNEGKVQYLFMQVKCAMYGLDLSGADTMIRFSLPYSFNEVSQSADRIVHPAKKFPLSYVDLVTRGTVDEDVVDVVQDKRLDARFFMNELNHRFVNRFKGGAEVL